MKLSGAEIIMHSLKDQGVKYIFGYPGGAVLHIYDAIHQQSDIEHILVRHEQGATHAADGYARATGEPGVALVTSGPGATNAVTGIATAYMDSIPLICITGQVPMSVIGSDAFQEVDTIGITRPCVKHNFLVKRLEDLADIMNQAFHIAMTGRPGPVVIDIPKNLTDPNIKIDYRPPTAVNLRAYHPTEKGHERQIKKAVNAILTGKRPVFYTGGGVILDNASDILTEFVRETGFPITNTLMGLGAYPASDPQYIGMLGMHGTFEANKAMHETDLLIAIGARFDDRITGVVERFCPNATIIHIDIDPASIDKTVNVAIPIVGAVKNILPELLTAYQARKLEQDQAELTQWWKRIHRWQRLDCLAYDRKSQKIKPQFVIETLHKVTKGDAFVTSDVGQHQMFAAQFYPFDKPRRWINSGGLGTMGFGLPAAMGVQFAHSKAAVACVTGEGSIQMCIQELATCLQYNLPLKIILLNNGYLGMVRQWQEFFYESRYSHTYMDSLPDFKKLAESYGHIGMNISDPAELEAKMTEAFAMTDRLVFMNILTDPEENVFPMIENGKAHNEMVLRVMPDPELI